MNGLWDLRKQLYGNGYRPVSIQTFPELLKYPLNPGWTELARCDPPIPAVSAPPDAWHQSTGVLADGLQIVDIDLDKPDHCLDVAQYCLDHLGDAPIRFRPNACRVALLYRAAEGSPGKAKAWKRNPDRTGEGVEVLGHGNNCMPMAIIRPASRSNGWMIVGHTMCRVTILLQWICHKFIICWIIPVNYWESKRP